MHSTDGTSSDLFSQCRGGPHNRPSSTTVWCVGISPTMVMVFTKRFSASLAPMGIPTSRLLIILWLKAHDDNTFPEIFVNSRCCCCCCTVYPPKFKMYWLPQMVIIMKLCQLHFLRLHFIHTSVACCYWPQVQTCYSTNFSLPKPIFFL